MSITIAYAGFGIDNSTVNVTNIVSALYSEKGVTQFQVSDCMINGLPIGTDPAPGVVKSLYIVWMGDDGVYQSGITPEKDTKSITLPSVNT